AGAEHLEDDVLPVGHHLEDLYPARGNRVERVGRRLLHEDRLTLAKVLHPRHFGDGATVVDREAAEDGRAPEELFRGGHDVDHRTSRAATVRWSWRLDPRLPHSSRRCASA